MVFVSFFIFRVGKFVVFFDKYWGLMGFKLFKSVIIYDLLCYFFFIGRIFLYFRVVRRKLWLLERIKGVNLRMGCGGVIYSKMMIN